MNTKSALPYFAAWLILNLVQSSFTELFHDEAHYWMFSQNLEWGFWDHPPATPFLIFLGYSIIPNELGARLFISLASLVTVWLLWKIVRPDDNRLFFSIVFSIFIVHIGGFMAAPDITLVLFTALFFRFYQIYIKDDSWKIALALAVTVAAMAYSKYHGAIVLLFALLSNWKVMKRTSFWLIPSLALVLYLPHLYWQYIHDFPTFRYHLIDRGQDEYSWMFILDYILGQLVIYGPFISIPLFIAAFRQKAHDPFERTMRWVVIGIFGFFFYRSFQERTEANWTATALIPMVYLAYHFFKSRPGWQKWVKGLAIPSILFLLVFRVFLMVDFLPASWNVRNEFHGWDRWAEDISAIAGDHPVVFYNTYRAPSKYQFYAQKPAHAINVWSHSGNQYDLMDEKELSIQGKRVLLVSENLKEGTEFRPGDLRDRKYRFVDDFRSFNRVKVKTLIDADLQLPPDTIVQLPIRIFNPTKETVDFNAGTRPVELRYQVYLFEEVVLHDMAVDTLPVSTLAPGESIETTARLKTPAEAGSKYRFRFTFHVKGLHNGRNSNFYELTVTE
jgi:hypothetical protein